MKKKILVISAFFAIFYFVPVNSYSVCVHRSGHPTGTYRDVTGDGVHDIYCDGDGTKTCPSGEGLIIANITVNGNRIDVDAAGQIVENNIKNNILSGQVMGDNSIGYFSWYFDAANVLIFTFDDGQQHN
jgi:hypothetical protein